MATKTEDPSASTFTPIVEDSSSDDEHKASQTTSFRISLQNNEYSILQAKWVQ